MMKSPQQIKELAKAKRKENSKFFRKLSNQSDLDNHFHEKHEEVFEEFDCLECANCCKTTSPLFTNKDIERIARHFRMRPAQFTEKYLRIDEDGDYVFQSSPCPFLGEDNYCGIYEVRPKACREYPHTDRKKMHQILDLTKKNYSICPAVFEIVERLKTVV